MVCNGGGVVTLSSCHDPWYCVTLSVKKKKNEKEEAKEKEEKKEKREKREKKEKKEEEKARGKRRS